MLPRMHPLPVLPWAEAAGYTLQSFSTGQALLLPHWESLSPVVTAAGEQQQASKLSSLFWENMLFPSANDSGGRNLTQNFLLKSSSPCSGQMLLGKGFWPAGMQEEGREGF